MFFSFFLLVTAAGLTLLSCGDGKDLQDENREDSVGELAPEGEQKSGEEVTTDSIEPAITQRIVIHTDRGDMVVGLYGEDAPKTVDNFVGLAERGFYDSIRFHRVERGFVLQAGDSLSKDTTQRQFWGTSGASIYGGEFADELNPQSPSGRIGYVEGTLAMANHGPNTNSSQFFIILTTEGAQHLPYAYTIFGKVLQGMDVAHKIEQTGMVLRENRDTKKVDTLFISTPMVPAMITGMTVEKMTGTPDIK